PATGPAPAFSLGAQTGMTQPPGSIGALPGSMFSGKTDELIRRLRRARIARQNVQVFKPVIDNRYSLEKVTSHAGSEFEATPLHAASQIGPPLTPGTTEVAVGQAQFVRSRVTA